MLLMRFRVMETREPIRAEHAMPVSVDRRRLNANEGGAQLATIVDAFRERVVCESGGDLMLSAGRQGGSPKETEEEGKEF